MTTTSPPEAVELVKRLTTKQRAALISATGSWASAFKLGAAGVTLRSLCWWWPKGADPISPCQCFLERDIAESPFRYEYRLTRLGEQAQAAILIEESRHA